MSPIRAARRPQREATAGDHWLLDEVFLQIQGPTRTFGPQGPTLGDLSDAYLQDYQVRQFRSQSTARGRVAHLTAFFGRAARAAALTTHQIRQYQLARRAAGAATGTINRETSALHRMGTLAVHWGWLDTVPGFPDRLRGASVIKCW